MRLLIITATEKERHAVGAIDDALIVTDSIDRTNAACTTTEALMARGAPFDAVISAGIAGILPGSNLAVGDVLVASSCIYFEEGIVTPAGFADTEAIGFPLGNFPGNRVPVSEELLDLLSDHFPVAPIATVATCSGTDIAAAEVARRTGAAAEAMEGAAVVHAARRKRVPAIEIRTMSNFTGDRAHQRWDLDRALEALSQALKGAVGGLRTG